MAQQYGRKYTLWYKRRSNQKTTIDILEKDYYGGVIELTGNTDCLQINFTGDVTNIYAPTQGSGTQLQLIVPALTMTDLFTDDPQKFQIKVYNGLTGVNLIWQGFLPCGIYTEDYSTSDVVEIQLICNDGMAVLEDISYRVSETGSTYTGFTSIASIFSTIIGKLNLTFNHIRSSISLDVENTSSNIFKYLTCNNNNFYNEQGEAMSCREVLNSIFQSLGVVMTFRGDTIYIIDPICLNDKTLGKQYDLTGGTEVQMDLGGILDITDEDLTYYQTGQQIDKIKNWNQIDIKYDPYTYLGEGYELNVQTIITGVTTWGWYNYSGDTRPLWQGDYSLTSGNTLSGWTITYGSIWGVREMRSGATEPGEPIYYLQRRPTGNQDGTYSYTFPLSQIIQDDNLMLDISMDTFINSRHYYNIINPSSNLRSKPLSACYLDNIQIEIGGHIWDGRVNKWVNTQHVYDTSEILWLLNETKIYVREYDQMIEAAYRTGHNTWFTSATYHKAIDLSSIGDSWTTAHMYIPIDEASVADGTLLSGSVKVTIYAGVDMTGIVTSDSDYAVSRDCLNILVKNLSLKIVDKNKIPIENETIKTTTDIVGVTTRKKSPLSIQLTNGTGVYGSSKAAFSSPLTSPQTGCTITGLSRSGQVPKYDAAKLLSQNLISQYKLPRVKMSANYDVTNYLLSIKDYLVQDTDYLGSKSFLIVNGTYYDGEEYLKCEMIELTSTRDTI